MKSKQGLFKPLFSHIYIEREILEHKKVRDIIGKFPDAVIIKINHYKDVFNKNGQDPGIQKLAIKLILAKNRGIRVLKGAPYCHDFGHDEFYYTSQVLNCPFDCSYCYLKGKFPSSNIVLFINTEDYFMELDQKCKGSSSFVTLSYDSDMAALEPLLGMLTDWGDYMANHCNITFELRTKSTCMPQLPVIDNLIVAVSILPDSVIELYERGTPRLTKRIDFINGLLEKGYRTRLCIDPVLDINSARDVYKEFITKLARDTDLGKINDVSVGSFRMPADYYRSMCRGFGNHFIHYYPFETSEKQVRYSRQRERELLDAVLIPLSAHMKKDKIYER